MSDNLIPRLDDMPAEALEAAAKAVYDDDPFGTPSGWEREGEAFRDLYRADVRAAYPHLARWVTAQALRKAADEINALLNAPDLIANADRYQGFYQGMRDGLALSEKTLREGAERGER